MLDVSKSTQLRLQDIHSGPFHEVGSRQNCGRRDQSGGWSISKGGPGRGSLATRRTRSKLSESDSVW